MFDTDRDHLRPAGNVSLNWRLIKAPNGVADYVIVHGAAHLLEANHGDRFWSVVRSQIPRVDASSGMAKGSRPVT